jgi:hypothetical protein
VTCCVTRQRLLLCPITVTLFATGPNGQKNSNLL